MIQFVLHYERTRYERISKLLYVDFLKDQNLEMLSDFVYAFRKRDYETCYEILKDPAIFNDILYSNILNFYLAYLPTLVMKTNSL